MKQLDLRYQIEITFLVKSKAITGKGAIYGTQYDRSPKFKTIEEAAEWAKTRSQEMQDNDF